MIWSEKSATFRDHAPGRRLFIHRSKTQGFGDCPSTAQKLPARRLHAADRTTVRPHGKRSVKMETLAGAALVLASGLTFSGIAATVIEIIAGQRLSLGEPFVSPRNIS